MEERDIAKMNPDHPRDGKNQIREYKELNCDKLRETCRYRYRYKV